MLIKVFIEDEYVSLESPKYENNNIGEVVVKVEPKEELYLEVLNMSQALHTCNADYIKSWDYTPEWEELISDMDNEEINLDCCEIVVTRNNKVYWKGVVKHTNMRVHTQEVDIDELFYDFIL